MPGVYVGYRRGSLVRDTFFFVGVKKIWRDHPKYQWFIVGKNVLMGFRFSRVKIVYWVRNQIKSDENLRRESGDFSLWLTVKIWFHGLFFEPNLMAWSKKLWSDFKNHFFYPSIINASLAKADIFQNPRDILFKINKEVNSLNFILKYWKLWKYLSLVAFKKISKYFCNVCDYI